MRGLRAAAVVVLGLAAAAALAGAGCRGRWPSHPFQRADPAPALRWTTLDPATVDVSEEQLHRVARYTLRLPAPAPGTRALELRFRGRLDGAKVDARATGPRHALTLLEGRRVSGDTVEIPIAPMALEVVTVTVHHHMRPVPLVAGVRLGAVAAQGVSSRDHGVAIGSTD